MNNEVVPNPEFPYSNRPGCIRVYVARRSEEPEANDPDIHNKLAQLDRVTGKKGYQIQTPSSFAPTASSPGASWLRGG